MRFFSALVGAFLLFASTAQAGQKNEIRIMPGEHKFNDHVNPLPHTYLMRETVPNAWNWANVNGVSYVTKNLNQHIPVYCGSCWAHGALSALADRIKIARKAQGVEINLAVQYILNCGTQVAGSCNGGDAGSTYEFIKQAGHVPYDTCMNYAACSHDSGEELCKHADYSCSAINTCRTCNTFSTYGGKCVGLNSYPNATIAEYGTISGADRMAAEIYARGPIACNVNADPLHNYEKGIFDDASASTMQNHVISVVGFGHDDKTGKDYWIARNSWGEYWGERGYFRIVKGQNQLGIEDYCAWATPNTWTEDNNFPCHEDGANCVATGRYTDPAIKLSWHM